MKHTLTPEQQTYLLKTLQARFEKHVDRHSGISWTHVEAQLLAKPEKLWSIWQMEETGGEPDVVAEEN